MSQKSENKIENEENGRFKTNNPNEWTLQNSPNNGNGKSIERVNEGQEFHIEAGTTFDMKIKQETKQEPKKDEILKKLEKPILLNEDLTKELGKQKKYEPI